MAARSADEAALNALGYRQEFKREFSLWSTFGVSCAVLGLLPSFASTLNYGMGYAGTGGMAWGWLVAFVFVQCVAAAMAELCSSMPTSGGLYYAAAVLAPSGWGPTAAWFTGWSNWLGQVTGAPSVDYALAAMVLAACAIANPAFTPTNLETFLLAVLLMVVHGLISSLPTLWIARLNSYGSTLNFLALVVVLVLIPLTAQSVPRFNAASTVWSIQNYTEWPDGVAVSMSFVAIIWTMSGFDASFHLSEECSNAATASPRSIVLTAVMGGIMGWFLQLVVAYTVQDIPPVMNSPLGQPWASYLIQVLPKGVALSILALTIVCAFSMGQGCMIAASRVTFAYARDDCFPASFWIKRVNKHTFTPVNAVWFNTVIGVCLLLLSFGGPVATGAIFSLGAIAAYTAFTIPIFIRVFFAGSRFRRGPWHLGQWSRPIGAAACLFVFVMMPILCFPIFVGSDLTLPLMNWTSCVYGGPMFLVMAWWVISARKWFKGPKVNTEHHMLGRQQTPQTIIEGVSCSRSGGDLDAFSRTKEAEEIM